MATLRPIPEDTTPPVEIVDCRKCGVLMMLGDNREDLCPPCWRRISQLEQRASGHRAHQSRNRTKMGAIPKETNDG